MDFFEYLAVMYSIILGLAAADLLRAVGKLVSRGDELRWDWIYATWLALMGLFIIVYWWAFWDLRAVGVDWTLARFIFVSLGPALLFLAVHVLLPDPAEVTDLRTHYEAVSKRFFLAMIPLTIWAISLIPLLLSHRSPNLASHIPLAAVVTAGFLSRRRSVHAIITVVAVATAAVSVLVLRASPG